ncbi:unnamed protein product [Knipowitschia caucasica]
MAEDAERVEPGESEDEVEDVYEVERIIDMRVEEGEVLYRVRWKNYCSDDDTWEPEAHLEDCREVLVNFKKKIAESKKEAEAKKTLVLPTKSELYDADSTSDSDRERPAAVPVKKKKKHHQQQQPPQQQRVEEPPPKDRKKKKKKKKKERRQEDIRPLPAPETDEEEGPPTTPASSPKRDAVADSDEDEPEPKPKLEPEPEPAPAKKHKKDKSKIKSQEAKKKRRAEVKADTSGDDTAPIEEDISEDQETAAEDSSTDVLRTAQRIYLDDKFKEKKGKWEVKLQGFKDLIQKKESKKPSASPKDSSLQKLKSLTTKAKEELASDSSDSSTAHRKSKSKERTPTAATSTKLKEERAKEERSREDRAKEDSAPAQKDSSTNLFEKFLLNCGEAKDRAPRRPASHLAAPEKTASKPQKIIGKIEKITKASKESPGQREGERSDKLKHTEAPSKASQSHGFSLDSEELEGGRPVDEAPRGAAWDRYSSTARRREDSEPRLFMACEEPMESQEEAPDRTEKSQATLSLGMDLNLDWMTLEDFQKHLNGEDEVLSGPPLSPSELRDAVKSGDYLAVKLALNSKEDYNLDQERSVGLMNHKRQHQVTTRSLRSGPKDVACTLPVVKKSKTRPTCKDHFDVLKSVEDETHPKKQSDDRCSLSQQFLSECEEIIHSMNQDHVSRHIQNDALICEYGQTLSAKHHHDRSHFPHVAQTMRELGRFVLAVKELDSNVQFLQDLFLQNKFDLVVDVAKKTMCFERPSSTSKSSSLVSKMGSSLKGAAEMALKGNHLKDKESELQIKSFIDLLNAKWYSSFPPYTPSPVKDMLLKVDASTVIPDLVKLHHFISQEEEEARRDMLHKPTLSTWKKLGEATLADVCLFNRLRVGNIGRLLLETYTFKRSTGVFEPSAEQIRKSTKIELELGEQMSRLELEGQFGRSMLVLLTQRMVSLIDLLVEHRDQLGVSQSNLYLFARTEGPSSLRGLDCLRRAAVECGVVNPEALLCPSLRQQVASGWQLLSLCESDLDRVSQLMGRCSQECSQLSQNTSLLEELTKQLLQMNQTPSLVSMASPKEGAQSKCPAKRRPWSEQEQAAVKRFLSEFISKMKVPGKKECNACLAAEPDLCRRSWTDIKNYVHNTLQTLKRRQNQPEKVKPERTPVKPRKPKPVVQSPKKHCEVTNNNHTVTEESSSFPADPSPGYVPFCTAEAALGYGNSTSLNTLDAQVVPSFAQLGTNTAMQPLHSPESRYLTSLQDPSSVDLPFVDLGLDIEPLASHASLNCPTTSMLPTYTTLSTAVFPPYSTANERNEFGTLDFPSSFFSTAPLSPVACTQAPAEDFLSAPSEQSTVYSTNSAAHNGSTSREEKLDFSPGQLADLHLVKVPGKREACWNRLSLQPEQQRGTEDDPKDFVLLGQCTQTLQHEWDPPVYLSL